MKNTSKHNLKETVYRYLFEQEEEEEEVFDDAESEAEDTEDEETPEGEEEDEAAAEEETVELSPSDEYALSDSIDNELDALLVDFEEEARKSAAVNQEEEISERVYRRLFENAAEDIDLRSFASNIARLVKNYQNLIDWESVILNKTESFVNNHYGEETVQALFGILEDEYDIAREAHQEKIPEVPVAVGARTPAG